MDTPAQTKIVYDDTTINEIIRDALGYIEGNLGAWIMLGAFILFIVTIVLFVIQKKRLKFYLIPLLFLSISISMFVLRSMVSAFYKPVIYLYPEKIQDVDVKLNYKGRLTITYPEYNQKLGGWRVRAHPNGKVINISDNREYSYLFWEGIPEASIYKMPNLGFISTGAKSHILLQDILQRAGLTPVEYNELIVYWYPQIANFKYVQIAFAGPEYEETAKLTINPKPDSVLRIFIYFKGLNYKPTIEPQFLKKFERKGFTVVEWGGTILP